MGPRCQKAEHIRRPDPTLRLRSNQALTHRICNLLVGICRLQFPDLVVCQRPKRRVVLIASRKSQHHEELRPDDRDSLFSGVLVCAVEDIFVNF